MNNKRTFNRYPDLRFIRVAAFSVGMTMFILYSVTSLFAANVKVSSANEFKIAGKNALPGDTITLSSGEWKNQELIIQANGTEQQPIVVRAETAGSVILNGSSKIRFSGSYLVIEGLFFKGGAIEKSAVIEFRTSSENVAMNCRLTNCAIVDYNPEDTDLDYKWVSVYGTKNRIDHNYFKGKTHQGTMLVVWLDGQPCEHLIDHNYFGPRPKRDENGAETIRIGTSDWWTTNARTIVENNYFYGCDGEVEIISNKSCENIYRYNTFVECEGSLTLRHGNRAMVYGNYFFGNHKKKTGGVRIIGEDHKVFNNYFNGLTGDNTFAALSFMQGVPDSKANGYMRVKNAFVVNNTFVDNKYNIIFGVMGSDKNASLSPLNCTIANNLIISKKGMLLEERAVPEKVAYQNNLFDGAIGGIKSTTIFSITPVEMQLDADSLWRPVAESAVIGSASGAFNFITDDIDGQTRGKKFDIGADQRSTDKIKRHPIRATDVGVSWKVQ